MASVLVSAAVKSQSLVLMEHFSDQEQLQDAINCSEECNVLLESLPIPPPFEYYTDHPRRKLDDQTRRQADLWLGESADHVTGLLEEAKRAVSVVKETRQRVRSRKEHNMEKTREVFNALRKVVNEREEQVITDIMKVADERENALKLQLERLLLLWTQLQNCLELMKKTRENKVTTSELVRRRKILERRQDHLMLMKRRSRLEPVVKEQREVEYKEVDHLCEEVTKLGGYPLDPSKCKVTFPTAMMVVNKETSIMIKLKDVNGYLVEDSGSEVEVEVSVTTKSREAIVVGPVKDVSGENYKVSFTPRSPGDHVISVVVGGNHLPGSPYKVPVLLRDYKMRERHCQVMTHYGGNKFGGLYDVAIGANDEVVIVDSANKCVIVLDCNFALLAVIGRGSGNSRLDWPDGVAVSKDGVIAVSDCGSSHQVKKYSLQGKLLSVIGNSRGSKNGQFNYPVGLVFSSNNMLYVVDGGNDRVQVFQPNDTFAFTFGSKGSNPGQFQFPARIAIDIDNKVLVTDHHGNHISLFSHTGSFISRITCDSPWSITVSPDGYIIAGCCSNDNIIKVWSPTHQLVHQFGNKGSQQGEFYCPTGIAMNSTGTIYVVEGKNKRLQVISDS